jgi:two-component system response regulator YesN
MKTDVKQINIAKAVHFIDTHYIMPLSLGEVAKESGMSKFYFARAFKSVTGTTFKNYHNQKRIEKAKKMLLQQKTSITDVCFSTGFNDVSYFNRVFKKIEGSSPSCFKKSSSGIEVIIRNNDSSTKSCALSSK